MTARLPLSLRLVDRRVVVVGAGAGGASKIYALVATDCDLHVVAPEVHTDVETLVSAGQVTLHRRAFSASDLDGAWLVIAAAPPPVNAEVVRAGEARRIFVNASDDPPNASALYADVIRRGPFTVAISADVELPGLTRLLREVLEQVLPTDRYIAAARELRRRWRVDGTPLASRFGELVRALAKLGDEGGSGHTDG